MITEAQLAAAKVPIDKVEQDENVAAGPGCTWYPPLRWGQFGGAFLTANKAGLSTQYERQAKGDWAYFEPTVIDGYPAVLNNEFDYRDSGKCSINVGVRDELTYYLLLQADPEGPFYKDPCAGAKKLASLAIQTMKGGG